MGEILRSRDVSGKFAVHFIDTPDKRQLRAGIWDLAEGVPPRAICVVLQGLGEFLEKYAEVADELRARGFTVVSLDWRSQGASERTCSGNRKGHVNRFGEYDIDLAMLLNRIVVPLGLPVVVLAHSMGAHILLRTLHQSSRRILCACLVAPMLDIDARGRSPRLLRILTFLLNLNRYKLSTRFVFGAEGTDPLDIEFEDNLVTSDRTRFQRAKDLLRAHPFLRINGATFGWLRAALGSMRAMRKPGYAKDMTTPLLVISAGKDRIVKTAAARSFAKRLSKARYIEFEDSEHEILMENDSIRARFWAEFDAFVNAQLEKGRQMFTSTAEQEPKG